MKAKPFAIIPAIVFCLLGIITPCKATKEDAQTITHSAEHSNKQDKGGQQDHEQFVQHTPSFAHQETRKLLDSSSSSSSSSSSCSNSPLKGLTTPKKKSARTCQAIAKRAERFCKKDTVKSHCPRACDACDTYGSSDSEANFIFEGTKWNCKWNRDLPATPSTLAQISDWCQNDAIRETCRETCSFVCVEPSSVPSQAPTVHPCEEEDVRSIIVSKFGEVTSGTPKGKALDWLINDIIDNGDCDNENKIIQRFVLAAFYFSTGGGGWSKKSGWLGSGDECSWHGLACNSDGALTGMNLGYQLKGTILEEIYALENLESLILRVNDGLVGTIPKGVGDLTKLKVLSLDVNKALGGTIPDLTRLTDLTVFDVDQSNLGGTITDQLKGLTKLIKIDLGFNAFGGQIPSDFSTFTKLQDLTLWGNSFDGGIDIGIFELPDLQRLELWGNRLSGPIPDNFGGSTSLRHINLSNNFFTGTIPDVTGNSLQNVGTLFLDRNRMSEPVPDSLCALRSSTLGDLRADCDPPGSAQNECPSGCCTRCYVGKGTP